MYRREENCDVFPLFVNGTEGKKKPALEVKGVLELVPNPYHPYCDGEYPFVRISRLFACTIFVTRGVSGFCMGYWGLVMDGNKYSRRAYAT